MRGALACHNCKKRKIRCDRELPICSFCNERGQACIYPLEAQKPGPKPGTVRKRRFSQLGRDDWKPHSTGRLSLDEGDRDPDRLSLLAAACGEEDAVRNAQSLSSKPRAASNNDMPGDTTPPINSFHVATPESNMLSRMIFPSHDTRPPSVNGVKPSPSDGQAEYARVVDLVCRAFEMTPGTYHHLVSLYFENMTSFSLFHQPQFAAKICAMASVSMKQPEALLAAMFSFSLHFSSGRDTMSQTSDGMLQRALQLIDEIMLQYGEDAPPLCILQAMILANFQQLTGSVRGRSWRSLGNSIRIAYELRLHQIDLESLEKSDDMTGDTDPAEWTCKEEKRRAWWALWELDVFACTIKCLPTAISWAHNMTYLPVDDVAWYNNVPTRSCELAEDPTLRWKLLEKCGNSSAKAWFIIANSFMRNAQVLSFSQGTAEHLTYGSAKETLRDTHQREPSKTADSERIVLENSLSCMTMTMPKEWAYRNEYLRFHEKTTSPLIPNCLDDSAKYSIHMMTQLGRLMIHRHEVFWHTHRILKSKQNERSNEDEDVVRARRQSTIDSTLSEQRAWNHYLDAANNIVTLVRSSSSDHVRHVNPMLANTIWLAAAAQVLCSVFGPEQTDRRVAESNLDLLRSTFKLYVGFWAIDRGLQDKLDNLETQLQGLKRKDAVVAYETAQERSQEVEQSINAQYIGNDMDSSTNGRYTLPSASAAYDPMILGNEGALQIDPMGGFNDPFNPFAIDLDELFAYGYA